MSKIYFPVPTWPHITPPVYPTFVDAGEQSFSFFLKERVLFEPKIGQMPGLHNLHEESAPEKERLIQGYICFLHQELQIIMT